MIVSGRKPFWVQWSHEPVRVRIRCTHDLRGYQTRHLPTGLQFYDVLLRLWALKQFGRRTWLKEER